HLGVAVAGLPAELEGLVEDLPGGLEHISRDALLRQLIGRVAVLADDAEEWLLVLVVLQEWPAVVAGDDRGLAVRLAVHDRRQGRREVPPRDRVVGEAA